MIRLLLIPTLMLGSCVTAPVSERVAPNWPVPGTVEAAAHEHAVEVLVVERNFAERAQRDGQWTAFRATASADAVMFVPQAVNAQQWLTNRTDPRRSVRWQPHAVYIACDGSLAATTGAAQWPSGDHGYFTTIWERRVDGSWKWIADHGDIVAQPRVAPVTPLIDTAECRMPATEDYRGAPLATPPAPSGGGQSRDLTLSWTYATGSRGGRALTVSLWRGDDFYLVIADDGMPFP